MASRGRGRGFRGRRGRGRGRGRGRKRGGGRGRGPGRNTDFGIDLFGIETIQDAPPSKKFPNETYPDFFLNSQIPRLRKMTKQTLSNERDKRVMRMSNHLDFKMRNSGYFVHGSMEVNQHFEQKERYLYHGTRFPKELCHSTKKKERIVERIDTDFADDDERLMVNQEVERLQAVNKKKGAENMIIDEQEGKEEDKNDILVEMETWDAMKDGESEEEFEIANFSGDEGIDGDFNEDALDEPDFGMDDMYDE